MKKILVPILTLILILSMTACTSKVTKSPPPSSGTPSSSESGTNDKTDETDKINKDEEPAPASSMEPTLEILQGLYAKAPEYEYMAIGYYQDPFHPDMVRDGYVPYEENYLQESMNSLQGRAHGINIRLHMTAANSATPANDEIRQAYLEQLDSRNLAYETSETASYDNDTLAICLLAYLDENENPIIALLYTDVRDDGTIYMCAEIEFHTAEFDDVTMLMLPEMEDVYALNFSDILGLDEN